MHVEVCRWATCGAGLQGQGGRCDEGAGASGGGAPDLLQCSAELLRLDRGRFGGLAIAAFNRAVNGRGIFLEFHFDTRFNVGELFFNGLHYWPVVLPRGRTPLSHQHRSVSAAVVRHSQMAAFMMVYCKQMSARKHIVGADAHAFHAHVVTERKTFICRHAASLGQGRERPTT